MMFSVQRSASMMFYVSYHYFDNIVALSVPGQLLAQVLTTGMSLKRDGMFLSYTGISTTEEGITWLADGTNVATSGKNYTVASIDLCSNKYGIEECYDHWTTECDTNKSNH